MVNAQEWLDRKYPMEKRKPIKELRISERNLEGELRLEGFDNLRELYCSDNKLTNLQLGNLPSLTELWCSGNYLADLDLNSLSVEELTVLNLSNNNFSPRDLTYFSRFINLKVLGIGNDYKKRIEQDIYNRFYGSLEILKNMKNLEHLGIANTDIDRGVEHLPYNMKEIYYSIKERPESKLGEITRQLDLFTSRKIDKWKEFNFTSEEIRKWIEVGLELDEYDFATYCKQKKYNSLEVKNDLEKLREEFWRSKKKEDLIIDLRNLRNQLLVTNKEMSELEVLLSRLRRAKALSDASSFNMARIQQRLTQREQEWETASKCRSGSGGGSSVASDIKVEIIEKEIKYLKRLERKETKVEELKNQVHYQELNKEIKKRKRELEQVQKNYVKKIRFGGYKKKETEEKLKEFLELQKDVFSLNAPSAISRKEKLEAKLTRKTNLSNEELNILCEKQNEFIQLETQLNEIIKEQQAQPIQYLDTPSDESTGSEEVMSIAPIVPTQWKYVLKEGSNFDEKYDDVEEVTYELIHEEKPYAWITNNEPLPLERLPIRLYNVEKENNIKDCVEEVKKDMEIENYATLSYIWGGEYNKESGELSPGGKKSLTKAIEACHYLGIKYLWIDQLCINQDDWKEKAQEIPKMRQYYSNSAVTLISIQKGILNKDGQLLSMDDIIKSIISSQWFSRSWTYQEGWLSKQTIFMFDDILVDGRAIASAWALEQPAYSEHGKYNNLQEFNQGSKKIATPLGWVYYDDGYNLEDTVSLSLNQTLRAVKERKRSLAIDGIYSILGLLPYGQKVTVDYSLSPEEALRNVMKVALQEGYGESLAWYGIGGDWIPKIDNSGSTSVVGSISVTYMPRNIDIIKMNGIEISGLKCTVENLLNNPSDETREGFAIDGGIYKRDVLIKFINSQRKYVHEKVKLSGTQESLEKVKKGDILIIPDKKKWESNVSFAILATRKGSCYHRIGLVEFRQELVSEKLEGLREEKLIIGLNSNISNPIIRKSKGGIEQELTNLQLRVNVWEKQCEMKEDDKHFYSRLPSYNREKSSPTIETKQELIKKMSDYSNKLQKLKTAYLKRKSYGKEEINKNLEEFLKSEDKEKKQWLVKKMSGTFELDRIFQLQKEITELQMQLKQNQQQLQANWGTVGIPFENFTEEVTQKWIERGFNKEQTKEWQDIGLKTLDYEYAEWLRDIIQLTPEQVLNEGNETELRELFQEYKNQHQFYSQTQISPK